MTFFKVWFCLRIVKSVDNLLTFLLLAYSDIIVMSIYESYMTSKSSDSGDEDENNDEESQPLAEEDTKIVLDDDQT